MARLSFLKTIVSVLFYISMVIMAFSIPFIIILAIAPEQVPSDITIKIAGEQPKVNAELILYLVAVAVACGFHTYALYLFRKILGFFEKKMLFESSVITALDQCGKAILIGYAIGIAAEVFYKLLTRDGIEIGLDIGLKESVVTVSLGLFFMVLSEVFLKAKKIKDENDLTV